MSTDAINGNTSVYTTAKQRLADQEKLSGLAKHEFKQVDQDHDGKISKDELVASQTAYVQDAQEKGKLADTWGQVFDAAAGKDGNLGASEFGNLVAAFTGGGSSDIHYATRSEVAARDPVAYNQHEVVDHATQRIDKLTEQKAELAKDLSDPKKRAEAKARMGQLDQQIGELRQLRHQAETFKSPDSPAPEDAQKTAEMLGKMKGLIKDLSDPKKAPEARGQLTALSSLLRNPSAYDPSQPMLTSDPAIKNQAIASQNVEQRVADLNAEKTRLIGDLSDPKKHDEARARIGLLNQQIAEVRHVGNQIESFHPPAGQSPEDAQKRADMIGKMNDLVKDLSDPKKAPEARGQLAALSSLLRNPSAYDPSQPMLTNDPTIKNQAIATQNAEQRVADLVGAKTDLLKDLSDPKKAPEARARLGLIDQQISDVKRLEHQIEGFHPPANQSPEDAQKTADMMGRLNGLASDLADPKKSAEAKGQVAALGSLLRHPDLYDPSQPQLTNDPVIKNQAIATQNMEQRVADLVGAKNDLIKDLSDPKKAPEAQARLGLLDQQIGEIRRMENNLATYHRPGGMSADQVTAAADTIAKMNDLVGDLSNPSKNAEAEARMTQLGNELRNPGLQNDPIIQNQTTVVQNLSQRIADLQQEQNKLIGDLSDPKKGAEAQARMQLLNQQISGLAHLRTQVEGYQRSPGLSDDQVKASADTLKQINDLTKDLSDPKKHDDAQSQLTKLLEQLNHPILLS